MSDISPKLILNAVLRKIWIVILCAIFCAATAYIYFSTFVSPVYRASASIIIANGAISTDKAEYIASTNITASTSMLSTCVDILKTKNAYEFLTEEFNNKYNVKNYMAMTSISIRSDDSLFIDIRVSNTSKTLAIKVANALAERAPEYIKSFIPSAEVTPAEFADSAVVISPRIMLMTLTAAFLGAIIPLAILVVVAISDTTVKGEDDLTNKYNVAILGNVPDFDISSR